MNRFTTFLLFAFIFFSAIFVFNGCKKKDWRDDYIGSYTGYSRYEKRSTNFVTGQAYGYDLDSFIKKNININIVINDKSDQLTFRISNQYICDADKDGYTNKPTFTTQFTADSIFVIESLPADTFFFGRNVYAAKRH
jgi:hypothetical protein